MLWLNLYSDGEMAYSRGIQIVGRGSEGRRFKKRKKITMKVNIILFYSKHKIFDFSFLIIFSVCGHNILKAPTKEL